MNKWISVEEDLPRYYKNVLVYCDNNEYAIAYTYTFPECAGDHFWEIKNAQAGDVTHWMELPESPIETS